MAKLVIGTDKTVATPAIVRDKSPKYYISFVNDNGTLKKGNHVMDFTGITTVQNFVLEKVYYWVEFPADTTIDMSSILSISSSRACTDMFNSASNVKSVDLRNLTVINGTNACQNMFADLATLESINLDSLVSISGNYACGAMLTRCHRLTEVSLPNLTTISDSNSVNGFVSGCSALKTLNFPKLSVISTQMGASYSIFADNCTKLESVSFGGLKASTFASLTNQFRYLFNSSTGSEAPNGCTVHFPSNFDPSDPNHTFDASTLTGYPTFNGSESYIHVAFDLPATE